MTDATPPPSDPPTDPVQPPDATDPNTPGSTDPVDPPQDPTPDPTPPTTDPWADPPPSYRYVPGITPVEKVDGPIDPAWAVAPELICPMCRMTNRYCDQTYHVADLGNGRELRQCSDCNAVFSPDGTVPGIPAPGSPYFY